MNLKQKLNSLRFDDKKEFNAHIGRILEICGELAAHGEKVEDANLVQILFKSLPRSFDNMAQSAAYQDNLSFGTHSKHSSSSTRRRSFQYNRIRRSQRRKLLGKHF
eukprot:IDg1308t1